MTLRTIPLPNPGQIVIQATANPAVAGMHPTARNLPLRSTHERHPAPAGINRRPCAASLIEHLHRHTPARPGGDQPAGIKPRPKLHPDATPPAGIHRPHAGIGGRRTTRRQNPATVDGSLERHAEPRSAAC